MSGRQNISDGRNANAGMYSLKSAFKLPTNMELPQGMYRLSPTSPRISVGQAQGSYTNGESSLHVASSEAFLVSTENELLNSAPSTKPSSSKIPTKSPSKQAKVPFQKEKNSPVLNDSNSSTGNADSETGQAAGRVEVLSEDKVAAIEERQLAIITKLTHLKEMITVIHERCMEEDSRAVPECVDVVVNANPRSPPYSVLFFYKLLTEYYGTGIRLQTHVHSSVTLPLKPHLEVFNQFKDTNPEATASISITLIWKTSAINVELLINPFTQSPIHGEANLARFFSRLLPNVFPVNYDTLDYETLVHVDEFLEEASDTRAFSLELVERHLLHLGKKSFLLGNATIADFVTFSSVATLVHPKGLKGQEQILSKLPNLRNWIHNCQEFGGFDLFPVT